MLGPSSSLHVAGPAGLHSWRSGPAHVPACLCMQRIASERLPTASDFLQPRVPCVNGTVPAWALATSCFLLHWHDTLPLQMRDVKQSPATHSHGNLYSRLLHPKHCHIPCLKLARPRLPAPNSILTCETAYPNDARLSLLQATALARRTGHLTSCTSRCTGLGTTAPACLLKAASAPCCVALRRQC